MYLYPLMISATVAASTPQERAAPPCLVATYRECLVSRFFRILAVVPLWRSNQTTHTLLKKHLIQTKAHKWATS